MIGAVRLTTPSKKSFGELHERFFARCSEPNCTSHGALRNYIVFNYKPTKCSAGLVPNKSFELFEITHWFNLNDNYMPISKRGLPFTRSLSKGSRSAQYKQTLVYYVLKFFLINSTQLKEYVIPEILGGPKV